MNYYSHHIGDYAAHTTHLSLLEHGVYRRMLDIYYLSETPFVGDLAAICRKVGARTDDEKAAVEVVLADFFKKTDDGFSQSRCDVEIAAFHEKSVKASTAASKRWKSDSDANAMPTHSERIADALPSHTERSANQEPITKNHKPRTINQEPVKSKAETAAGTRLPADWMPDDSMVDFCNATRPDLHPEAVAHHFRDYWISQPGAKGRKADWHATWRNWVRSQKPSMQARASPAGHFDIAAAQRAATEEGRRLLFGDMDERMIDA